MNERVTENEPRRLDWRTGWLTGGLGGWLTGWLLPHRTLAFPLYPPLSLLVPSRVDDRTRTSRPPRGVLPSHLAEAPQAQLFTTSSAALVTRDLACPYARGNSSTRGSWSLCQLWSNHSRDKPAINQVLASFRNFSSSASRRRTFRSRMSRLQASEWFLLWYSRARILSKSCQNVVRFYTCPYSIDSR